jgi:peptidoglycan hydrolase-like protein with peptidoglycan-binding domain
LTSLAKGRVGSQAEIQTGTPTEERIIGNFRCGREQAPFRTQRAELSFSGEQIMKPSDILLAFVAAGALVAGPAFAGQSRNETAPRPIKSSTLMEAQKKLNQEGFDAGRADGKWGTKTTEAVKSFQEKNNLPPTGKLDEQTLADLGIGTPSGTGRSASEKQSSEPSESSNMSSSGQQNMMHHQNMMEQDHMGGGNK